MSGREVASEAGGEAERTAAWARVSASGCALPLAHSESRPGSIAQFIPNIVCLCSSSARYISPQLLCSIRVTVAPARRAGNNHNSWQLKRGPGLVGALGCGCVMAGVGPWDALAHPQCA